MASYEELFTAAGKRMASGERPEEGLLPVLKDCLVDGPLGPMIKHPLVVSLTPIAELVNAQYEQKLVASREAEERGDWDRVLRLRERPFRMESLLSMWEDDEFDVAYLARLLRWVWVDSEDPQIYGTDRLVALFGAAGFVTDEETHDGPPTEPIMVFRGTLPRWTRSLAWTRSMDIAVWFAQRYDRGGSVYEATVEPCDVLGMFDGRGEQEVVIDPKNIRIRKLQ